MIKFEITARFSGRVLFEADIEATADTPFGVKLGLAVKAAVKARANLAGAYLADAYLADANLADAYLADANLARAYLADANLAGAYLADAYLAGAYLADANLARAYLAGANLAGANLAGANLADAYLADANLADANLAGAYLADAKWSDGVPLTMKPLQVSGLRWPVTILDRHMQIGCQLHSLVDWASFDDERILRMDGRDALKFWRAHKAVLLGMAQANGRSITPLEVPEAA